MSFLGKERRLDIARVALAVTTLLGTPVAIVSDSPTRAEQQYIIDLGLKIDEAGFFKIASQGPRWGTLPKNADKDKLACPNWSPNICMGEYSSSFNVGINGPMADFMFKQSQLSNPLLPTKIVFVEDWQEINSKEHTSGFTGITADGKEMHVVMSLKAAAWEAFRILDQNRLGLEYFEGTLSALLSRHLAHELGHAGAELKKLAKPGDATHPQVYAFDRLYDELYRKAGAKGVPEGGLIFGAQPKDGLNLLAYRNQLYQEAKDRGIDG